MVATSTTSFRQSAAVAVIAGAAVLASFGMAKGQQLAATDVASDRQAYLASECNHIRDLNERTGCYGEATIRFSEMRIADIQKERAAIQKRGEKLDQQIDASKTAIAESNCSVEVTQGLKSGDARFAPERGKAILNGKRPSEFGWCRFLEQLKRS